MVRAAHVMINDAGELIGVDQQFCDLMQAPIAAMRGKAVLDVTAPADRAECAEAIERLRETGVPFVITKRFLRNDGSLVWVRNTVSTATDLHGLAVVIATIEPVAEPVEDRGPARLLGAARFLAETRRNRADICDPILFSEPGWDTVLACYTSEAEGRPTTVAGLVEMVGHDQMIVGRWVAALVQHDVLEIETRNPSAHAAKSFRLTARTHQRLEAYLGQLSFP